jgi:hypothetical protein
MNLAQIVGTLKVDDRAKQKLTRMAAVYEDNLEENITKTHFELGKKTGIPHDEWAAFLRITEIASWVNETMKIMATAGERRLIKQLGEGGADTRDVNAYKAIKEFNTSSKSDDNTNVVIMYLPPEE